MAVAPRLVLAICTLLSVAEGVRFVVVGDFGVPNSAAARNVSRVIHNLAPDFIVTMGDNVYTSNIDDCIGRFYADFIYPYNGRFGNGSDPSKGNRFFPCLGNHDYSDVGLRAYRRYFELPGNERYYDFVRGPVHFFAVNSNPEEPDGLTSDSVQGQWLKERLGNSTSPHKLVYFHHPPYHSSMLPQAASLRWPFREWGATLVMTGHVHLYERLEVDGLPYIVNGVGGRTLSNFRATSVPGSLVRWKGFGFMVVTADRHFLNCTMFDQTGLNVVDDLVLRSAGNRRVTNDGTGMALPSNLPTYALWPVFAVMVLAMILLGS